MNNTIKLSFFLLFILVLSGCSSTLFHKVVNMPAWILTPDVEGGVAVSECVAWSGDFKSDKAQAADKSISSLNQTLKNRFLQLEQFYQSGTQAQATDKPFGHTLGQSFQQITNKVKVVRVDFADFDDAENLCTMVHLKQEDLEQLVSKELDASDRPLDEQQKRELLQRFTSAESS